LAALNPGQAPDKAEALKCAEKADPRVDLEWMRIRREMDLEYWKDLAEPLAVTGFTRYNATPKPDSPRPRVSTGVCSQPRALFLNGSSHGPE
jgi:hypothetical protein